MMVTGLATGGGGGGGYIDEVGTPGLELPPGEKYGGGLADSGILETVA